MLEKRTSAVCIYSKNYSYWEFYLWMFVNGKELWNHLDGSYMVPTDPIELQSWETKDVKVVSWLLSSIEPHMVNNVYSFNTTKEMWGLLWWMYHQITLHESSN